MILLPLIEAKRDGGTLSTAEIQALVRAFPAGHVLGADDSLRRGQVILRRLGEWFRSSSW
jgi:hypothetical protein